MVSEPIKSNRTAQLRSHVEQISAWLLAFVFVLTAVAPAWAQSTVSVEEVQGEISQRLMDVPEFRFIRAEAQKQGVRVWLFGGTAAGYAHYVKWDLLRKKNDGRYQPDRFDYDFTNIYRSTQDLDIVVDGTSDQIETLQKILGEKYPHFLGSNSKWELRSLRERKGSPGAGGYKEALLNDFDFLNQHTDSNSTGMIEVTPASGSEVVKDLRDWKSARPNFLEDVVNGRMTFYFSKKHFETSRAKAGKNPEILSVMRALTKAFQFELDVTPEDYVVMKRIIGEFEFKSISRDSDLVRRFADIATKLVKNAVNLEAAMNTVEKIGLRAKLLEIGSTDTKDSVAWWANKEPLRSKRVGQGDGKTAAELGLDIVAHETNNFLAYESITRAHTGDPNVFISRNHAAGEAAVHGEGFYTRTGREGARGTGLTIRFKVNPRARLGADFTMSGDYVVFKNKKAFRVIPESLQLSLAEYFEFLAAGEIAKSDKAILEKFRRRLSRMSKDVTPEEEARIVELVSEKISGASRLPAIVGEFFDLDISGRHPDVIENLIRARFTGDAIEMMARSATKFNETLIHLLLTDGPRDKEDTISKLAKAMVETPEKFYSSELIETIIEQQPKSSASVALVISKRVITAKEMNWIERIATTDYAFRVLAENVLPRPEFDGAVRTVEALLERKSIDPIELDLLVEKVLSKPVWRKRTTILDKVISRNGGGALLTHVLANNDVPDWDRLVRRCYHGRDVEKGLAVLMHDPRSIRFAGDFAKILRGNRFDLELVAQALAGSHWTVHPELIEIMMTKEDGPALLSKYVFSQPHWREKRDLRDRMGKIDKSTSYPRNVLAKELVVERLEEVRTILRTRDVSVVATTVANVLAQPGWENHPELVDLVMARDFAADFPVKKRDAELKLSQALTAVFRQPHWAKREDLFMRYIDWSDEGKLISTEVLPLPHWRNSKALVHFFESVKFFYWYPEQLFALDDWKTRVDAARLFIGKSDSYALKEMYQKLFSKPGWETRSDVVAFANSRVDASRNYGRNGYQDGWSDTFMDLRWNGHPEVMRALLMNESLPDDLAFKLVNTPAWSSIDEFWVLLAERHPSFPLLVRLQNSKRGERNELIDTLIKGTPNYLIKSWVESKTFIATPAVRAIILDQMLSRPKDPRNDRENLVAILAKQLEATVPGDAELLSRSFASGIHLGGAARAFFVETGEWSKRYPDLLEAAIPHMSGTDVENLFRRKNLPNRKNLLRLAARRHPGILAAFVAAEPIFDHELADELIFDKSADSRTADPILKHPESARHLVWLEVFLRRGVRSMSQEGRKITEQDHWKNHPELNHLVGTPTLDNVARLFASGFTFMTADEFARAGLKSGNVRLKRVINERLLRRPIAQTRCERLFVSVR